MKKLERRLRCTISNVNHIIFDTFFSLEDKKWYLTWIIHYYFLNNISFLYSLLLQKLGRKPTAREKRYGYLWKFMLSSLPFASNLIFDAHNLFFLVTTYITCTGKIFKDFNLIQMCVFCFLEREHDSFRPA